MIYIDSGYLIALFDSHDALHNRAIAWSRALHERSVLSDYVLLETINHFSRPLARPRAYALLDQVERDPECELVHVDQSLLTEGLQLFRDRPDKGWSLVDCVSFVIMRKRGIARALAYDLHFEQAGFEALLRRDPP